MSDVNNPNGGDSPQKESFSFQDLMSDLGELPVAEPKKTAPMDKPVINPTRNRVGAMPVSQSKPGAPKAIYDRPRVIPTEVQDPAPAPRPGGKGQPAAIFFEDDRRKSIQDEQDKEAKRLDELDRINSKVLAGSAYQKKPLWRTALLFAFVTAALLAPNLGSNEYREMFDPWLSFGVVFFGAVTVLISVSCALPRSVWARGRVLWFIQTSSVKRTKALSMDRLMNFLDLGQILQFVLEHKYWLVAAIPVIVVIVVVRNLSR